MNNIKYLGYYLYNSEDLPEALVLNKKEGIITGKIPYDGPTIEDLQRANRKVELMSLSFKDGAFHFEIKNIKERCKRNAVCFLDVISSAYEYLLQLILDRRARKHFDFLIREYYYTKQEILLAPIKKILSLISGDITLSLYKGNINYYSTNNVLNSLYCEQNASMESIGSFDHTDAEGFINILSLQAKQQGINKNGSE